MFKDDKPWAKYANCLGLPDENFFPPECDLTAPDGEVAEVDREWYEGAGQLAVAICRRCIVRVECFEYSLTQPVTLENGVYGGSCPKDRQRYLEAVSIRTGRHPVGDEGEDQGGAGNPLDSHT